MKYLYLLLSACFCTWAPIATACPAYTWIASTPNASIGTSSFVNVSEELSIAASGATGGIGADETGLGLACCDNSHEVSLGQPITLNPSNRFSHHVTGIALILDSIQGGETGQACDSPGLCATIYLSQDANSVGSNLFNEMKAHNSDLLKAQAENGDTLLNQLETTTSTVPEPGGLLLMGTGLVLVATRVRRKLRA